MTSKNAQHLQNGRFSILRQKKKSANICSADCFFRPIFVCRLIFFSAVLGGPTDANDAMGSPGGQEPPRSDRTQRTNGRNERMNE